MMRVFWVLLIFVCPLFWNTINAPLGQRFYEAYGFDNFQEMKYGIMFEGKDTEVFQYWKAPIKEESEAQLRIERSAEERRQQLIQEKLEKEEADRRNEEQRKKREEEEKRRNKGWDGDWNQNQEQKRKSWNRGGSSSSGRGSKYYRQSKYDSDDEDAKGNTKPPPPRSAEDQKREKREKQRAKNLALLTQIPVIVPRRAAGIYTQEQLDAVSRAIEFRTDFEDELQDEDWQVFGYEKATSWENIRQMYRKLSLLLHPDKVHGVPEQDEAYKVIQTAYERIKNYLGKN